MLPYLQAQLPAILAAKPHSSPHAPHPDPSGQKFMEPLLRPVPGGCLLSDQGSHGSWQVPSDSVLTDWHRSGVARRPGGTPLSDLAHDTCGTQPGRLGAFSCLLCTEPPNNSHPSGNRELHPTYKTTHGPGAHLLGRPARARAAESTPSWSLTSTWLLGCSPAGCAGSEKGVP